MGTVADQQREPLSVRGGEVRPSDGACTRALARYGKQGWLRGGFARGRKLVDKGKTKNRDISHKNSEGGAVRDVITLDKSLA